MDTIPEELYYGCKSLTGPLTIPEDVVEIGNNAFDYCSGLTGLSFPNSLKIIGRSAFGGCDGLRGSLNIPEGVTTIGSEAFDECGLDGTLTIPSSVTKLGYIDFATNPIEGKLLGNKTELKKVINNSSCTLYLPDLDNDFWIDNKAPEFKITYIYQGIALRRSVVTFFVDDREFNKQIISPGEKIIKPNDPTKEGKAFDSWYTSAKGTTKWNFEDSVQHGLNLYARFKDYRNVTFINNNTTLFTMTVVDGDIIDKEQTLFYSDPSFTGWAVDNVRGELWNFDDSVTKDLTLYAVWENEESSDAHSDSQSDSVDSDDIGNVIESGNNQQAANVGYTLTVIPATGSTSDSNSGSIGASTDNSTKSTNVGQVNKTNRPSDGKNENWDKELAEIQIDTSSNSVSEVAEQIRNAADRSTIILEMKDNTEIDIAILESAKGRDIDIVLDMGEYSWTINGRNITVDNLQSINMEVKFGSDAISSDKIEKFGGLAYKTISLTHEGDFGFAATLTMNVGAENSGKYANLYYYNETDGDLEFLSSDKVRDNGDINLLFTHASEYVAVISESIDEQLAQGGDLQQDETPAVEDLLLTSPEKAETSNNMLPVIILLVILALVIVGMAIFVIKRKDSKS